MRSEFDDEQRSIVERIVGRDLDEDAGLGKPLTERASQRQRSVEAYLQAGVRPRWMERVGEIDAQHHEWYPIERHRGAP